MGYCIKATESSAAGVKRIANEQLDRAIEEIDDSSLTRHECVHQVRKRCKKLRGLLRLVRPELGAEYSSENAWFRDSARELSQFRDAQALLECCDKVLNYYAGSIHTGDFAELEYQLAAFRDKSAAKQSDIENALFTFRQRISEAKDRVENWPLQEQAFDLFSKGLAKTYRRGRSALRAAYQEPTVENFHEWRKRVKYHWYHTRLLKKLWPELMESRADELKKLADYLGDDHDLAVLEQTLLAEPESFGPPEMREAFVGLLRQRQAQLRQAARPLGERLFAEKATRHAKRLERYWQVWRQHGG